MAFGMTEAEKLAMVRAKREFVWGYLGVMDPADGQYKIFIYIGRVLSWKWPISSLNSLELVPDL